MERTTGYYFGGDPTAHHYYSPEKARQCGNCNADEHRNDPCDPEVLLKHQGDIVKINNQRIIAFREAKRKCADLRGQGYNAEVSPNSTLITIAPPYKK